MSKLERLFNFMKENHKVTSLEIQKHINTVAVGSAIADLRKRGCNIPPAKYIGKSKDGSNIYEYTMISWPATLFASDLQAQLEFFRKHECPGDHMNCDACPAEHYRNGLCHHPQHPSVRTEPGILVRGFRK